MMHTFFNDQEWADMCSRLMAGDWVTHIEHADPLAAMTHHRDTHASAWTEPAPVVDTRKPFAPGLLKVAS